MSFHTDLERWKDWKKEENCPVCSDQDMPDDMVDVYEYENTWLNAEPKECLKGACHVTAKFHAVELFELTDDQLVGSRKHFTSSSPSPVP